MGLFYGKTNLSAASAFDSMIRIALNNNFLFLPYKNALSIEIFCPKNIMADKMNSLSFCSGSMNSIKMCFSNVVRKDIAVYEYIYEYDIVQFEYRLKELLENGPVILSQITHKPPLLRIEDQFYRGWGYHVCICKKLEIEKIILHDSYGYPNSIREISEVYSSITDKSYLIYLESPIKIEDLYKEESVAKNILNNIILCRKSMSLQDGIYGFICNILEILSLEHIKSSQRRILGYIFENIGISIRLAKDYFVEIQCFFIKEHYKSIIMHFENYCIVISQVQYYLKIEDYKKVSQYLKEMKKYEENLNHFYLNINNHLI